MPEIISAVDLRYFSVLFTRTHRNLKSGMLEQMALSQHWPMQHVGIDVLPFALACFQMKKILNDLPANGKHKNHKCSCAPKCAASLAA